MRTIRFAHFAYVVVMLLLDSIINAVFRQFAWSHITFISNLAFMAILLLTQNDSREETIIKAGLLGIWMDLNHIASFPIFFIAYTVTVVMVRLWDRHIGTTALEFVVMVIIAIFVKEIITFVLIYFLKGFNQSLAQFMSTRIFWVVLGNIALIPVVRYGYNVMHKQILKRAQNVYMR
ncbi:hypothetical protein G7062_07885 [Erysipelothrix sp. HDW6C]|uniref:hypothetical protein n=1 Tax=Erysipelothrix sp. HDW6C TaxID=2714930 RepID=UPI0014086818|nr:hypothetical protein [Erysipelothrix sp. HDW6C]QIK70213.1 hypothetical protein G7062_07885 [Erysipelothrix sp. HDW6C]